MQDVSKNILCPPNFQSGGFGVNIVCNLVSLNVMPRHDKMPRSWEEKPALILKRLYDGDFSLFIVAWALHLLPFFIWIPVLPYPLLTCEKNTARRFPYLLGLQKTRVIQRRIQYFFMQFYLLGVRFPYSITKGQNSMKGTIISFKISLSLARISKTDFHISL